MWFPEDVPHTGQNPLTGSPLNATPLYYLSPEAIAHSMLRGRAHYFDRHHNVVQAGDTLYTASMIPIMSFLEDTGPGVHDTTAAACR